MPDFPTPSADSPFVKLFAAGATVVRAVNLARGLLPGSRSSVLMVFGGGALIGAGVGVLGVALAVPEVRRLLLERAATLASQLRTMAGTQTAHPAPSPSRSVHRAPRPRPVSIDDEPVTVRPS